MSTRTIPAQVIQSCDCCSDVLSPENHREEGILQIRANALDLHGIACADASRSLDLCDACLQRMSRAIDMVCNHRVVMAPPDLANLSTAPEVLNAADKAMWVTGWNECATRGFKA